MTWNTYPLSDLCQINIGRTPSRDKLEYWGEGYPWLSIGDMNKSFIAEHTKEQITARAVANCGMKPAIRGTVLLSFKLSIGKVCIAGRDLYTNEAIAALPILSPKRMTRDFLAWSLRSIDLTAGLDRAAKGLTLNKAKLATIKLAVPPVNDQRHIANVLDQADAIRHKRQQSLERLEELDDSLFSRFFGDASSSKNPYPLVKCSNICERITVGIVVRPASYYQDAGIPALRSLNIEKEEFNLENLVFFSKADNETKLSKTRVFFNDIVVVRTGQPGKAAVIPENLDGVNAIDLLLLTPKLKLVHPLYLCSFLNSAIGKRMVLSSQRGQIQQHLNVGSLNEALVPLPPLARQLEFVEAKTSTKSIRDTYRDHLRKLDALFSSLQHRAFRGELTAAAERELPAFVEAG